MNLSTDIKPASHLKAHTDSVLKQLNETHRPLIITENGEAKAVLQDLESYENMKNALGLMKLIAQGEKDIRNGKTQTNEEIFEELEALLEEK